MTDGESVCEEERESVCVRAPIERQRELGEEEQRIRRRQRSRQKMDTL